jgi:hypothetical protein
MALLASKLSSFDKTEEDIRERMKARESATSRTRTTAAVQEYDNDDDSGGGASGGGDERVDERVSGRERKHSQMDNETDLHEEEEEEEFKRAGVGFRSVVQPVEVSLDHKRAQELLNHRNKIMKEKTEQVEVNRYIQKKGREGGGVMKLWNECFNFLFALIIIFFNTFFSHPTIHTTYM